MHSTFVEISGAKWWTDTDLDLIRLKVISMDKKNKIMKLMII